MKGVKAGHAIHEILRHQPQQKYQRIISKNQVHNTNLTVADVKRAETILEMPP